MKIGVAFMIKFWVNERMPVSREVIGNVICSLENIKEIEQRCRSAFEEDLKMFIDAARVACAASEG